MASHIVSFFEPLLADLGVTRKLRERLVIDARKRLASSWAERGSAKAELGWIDSAFDPDVLTIGFARRFATYKRAVLVLSDLDRLRARGGTLPRWWRQ